MRRSARAPPAARALPSGPPRRGRERPPSIWLLDQYRSASWRHLPNIVFLDASNARPGPLGQDRGDATIQAWLRAVEARKGSLQGRKALNCPEDVSPMTDRI